MRTSEGTWLPIGHFVPRDSSCKITHGICPQCVGGISTCRVAPVASRRT